MKPATSSGFADPVFEPTAAERSAGELSDDSIRKALAVMRRVGFVQYDQVMSPSLIQALEREHEERRAKMSPASFDRAQAKVGDERFMMSVEVSGPFADPQVYANRYLLPLVSTLLGGEPTLIAFGVVSALAGSKAQRFHLDYSPLFSEPHAAPLLSLLPSHAVTVVVPLVDLTPETGTTAVCLGSHLEACQGSLEPPAQFPLYHPQTRLGSVYLMDYRLLHGGTANNSQRSRPILFIVYARPWFFDHLNPEHTGVRLSPESRMAVPVEHQPLFRRAIVT
jgi:Phytanoyl-CoA dioxygenase (PhyH)